MRRISRITTAGALVAALLGGHLAHGEDANGGTKRPRDPWVFRSVLDGHARMLTCELSDKLSIAYDTQTCSLYRVWAGGVKFTGGVYDARHGPQPESVGKAYLEANTNGTEWKVPTSSPGAEVHPPQYLGYRIQGSKVTLDYAIESSNGRIRISESPECEFANGQVTLIRTFTISGLKEGTRSFLRLDLMQRRGFDAALYSLTPANGAILTSALARGGAATRPATGPATLVRSIDFERDGTVALRMSWSEQ